MKISANPQLKINAKKRKITIILPYFNEKLGLELLKNIKKELKKQQVPEKNIQLVRTAGSLELPYTCQKIAQKKKSDVIIALGIIIRGETTHYDLVTNTTYQGLMQVQLTTKTPIIFGVLTCENKKQAEIRIKEKAEDFALAALIQTNL